MALTDKITVCEHEKNIKLLIDEFGGSCSKEDIKEMYNLKKEFLEKNKDDRLPYTSHIVTYSSLKDDLDLSFPDNVPNKEIYNSIKSYKNDINS